MTINSEHRLSCDIFTLFKKGKEPKIVAKRNEVVKIVFISTPAVIVESKRGERFTVNVSKLN